MAQFTLTDEQKVDLAVGYVDAAGNATAAPAGTTLTASSADDTVVTVAVSGDVATVTTTGKLSSAPVTVTVTDGTLSGSLDFVVVSSAATGLGLTPGMPAQR